MAKPPTTSTVTPVTLTINQLEVSPLNVRRHRATIEALSAMEASILGSGLIQPLNVHPLKASKKLGAFAGGRRCRAIRNLVDRGELPRDWPIKAERYDGFTDVEIIELSLGENIPRAELELYEICAGIRALDQRGEPVDRIATALGQPLDIVRRWQRVGQLAEPLFEAFAAGQLSADQARAYAATTDQQLQLAVWNDLRPLPAWQQADDKIRAALKVGDLEASRLLRFVGDEAYRQAGGRFELDLFAGEAIQRGRVVDEGVLRQLVDERFAGQREELRRRTGRPDLRFVAQPPQREGIGTDASLRVEPGTAEGDAIVLPSGDIVARLYVNDAGEAVADWWWSSRKAKFGQGGQGSPSKPASLRAPAAPMQGGSPTTSPAAGPAGSAPASAADTSGLTESTVEVLRSVRRLVMRGMLVRGPRDRTVGTDYLVWAQLRLLLDPGARPTKVGMRAIEQLAVDPDNARPVMGSIEASSRWRDALAGLTREAFIQDQDMPAAFLAYRAAELSTKQLAGAVVAGLALERSLAGGRFDLPIHDVVAFECGIVDDATFRRVWEPSAEQLDILPTHHRFAIAEPLVERVTLGAWQRLKSAELTARILELVTGTAAGVRASMSAAAATWVLPALGFRPAEPAEHPREAAE